MIYNDSLAFAYEALGSCLSDVPSEQVTAYTQSVETTVIREIQNVLEKKDEGAHQASCVRVY